MQPMGKGTIVSAAFLRHSLHLDARELCCGCKRLVAVGKPPGLLPDHAKPLTANRETLHDLKDVWLISRIRSP
jgi:hypothetical protein